MLEDLLNKKNKLEQELFILKCKDRFKPADWDKLEQLEKELLKINMQIEKE